MNRRLKKLVKTLPSAVRGWLNPPTTLIEDLDQFAATAKKSVEAYRKGTRLDRSDAVRNHLENIMWLCYQDPRYGDFDENLNWASGSFQDPGWWRPERS